MQDEAEKAGNTNVPGPCKQDRLYLRSRKPNIARPVAALNRATAQKGNDMFEIHFKPSFGYWWHLKANNGEILCHSEGYAAKQGAQNGIDAVKRIAANALVYDRT